MHDLPSDSCFGSNLVPETTIVYIDLLAKQHGRLQKMGPMHRPYWPIGNTIAQCRLGVRVSIELSE